MRRLLTGAVFTMSVCGLAGQAFAETNTAPPPPAKGGDDEELVLEDEGTPPAANEPAVNLNDSSFLDASAEGGAEGSDPLSGDKPAAGAKADGSADVAIDADALDERMISVVSRQPMLNVYKDDPDGDGKGRTIHRWDIQPQAGISVNDPYVRHWALGGEINWWITNRLALGLGGHYFIGQKTNNYNRQKRQQHLLLTANRFLWEASGAILYEPFYGKFAIFNKYLLHWEAYVQAGGGVIQTEIIPRFEAIHEPFKSIRPQGNVALGARFYLPNNKFMSVNLGVRTWIFTDVYEPDGRTAVPEEGSPDLSNPDKARAEAVTGIMAYNAVFFLGLSFYLPTDFQYSTRR